MNLEIIQDGRVLRTHNHNGQLYAEAPETGEYEIRLTNTSPNRRMAVVSVDGKNVIDGKDAGVNGSGYVLDAWQSMTIRGFLRGSSECARFTFTAAGGSYAAQMGSGTKNTGVIGVAVFDEKPKPVVFQPPIIIQEHHHHHHHPRRYDFWTTTTIGNLGSSHSADSFSCGVDSDDLARGLETLCSTEPPTKGLESNVRSRRSVATSVSNSVAPDIGTAYGRAEAFFTTTTSFERASTNPVLVLSLRYGVTAKLREWGVPVDGAPTPAPFPNAFPASPGFAQPPAGWRG